jgi:hypothetical protein
MLTLATHRKQLDDRRLTARIVRIPVSAQQPSTETRCMMRSMLPSTTVMS